MTEDLDAISRTIRQAGLAQSVVINGGTLIEGLIEVTDIHYQIDLFPTPSREAALGHATEQRHLATFEDLGWLAGAGAGPLTFAAARGGLAVAAPRSAANPFLALAAVDALVNGAEVH